MNSTVSWDDQRVFLAVLETGSLSAAGRRLGLSHPSVRARIESLEAALGVTLFTRSVRGFAPTDTALTLGEAARTMSMASALFVRQASTVPGQISGTVRLSVSETVGVEVIPPMLASLQDRYPGLRVELSVSNQQADILAREVDIAVRNTPPKQVALLARKVDTVAVGLFASPQYLARHGMPAKVADLDRHRIIGPDRDPVDLAIAHGLGPIFASERYVLRTDSHAAQIAASRSGLGIVVCQVHLGERDPRLVRVIPDFQIGTLQTWIVTHEDQSRIERVRAAFDHLVEGFRSYSRGAA